MSLTAMIAMAMTMVAADPVDTARKEFNDCLVKFTNESLDAKKPQSDFTKESATACPAEKAKLVELMVKAEMQYGGKKDEAESYANDETQMIIDSYVGSYGDFMASNTRHGK
ncbi:hypothetical protein C7451_11759 [Blastomonas natatoria]|uniref:Uncharacterized protein n=1 Tax=Blastomonas natatoria TaxID=34015 RepID=A0A2V3UQB0_9SPHN|nr:hypothetical protein [Blastomonas natatoria]PXW68469.1 hypothetical protein C7451_11759 [Blastomonas natatoria]